jgi:hypothetical protein
VSIKDATTVDRIAHGIRLPGHVRELSDKQVVRVPDDHGDTCDVVTATARIEDLAGDTMETVDMLGDSLHEKLYRAHRRGDRCEFLGRCVLLPLSSGRAAADLALMRRGCAGVIRRKPPDKFRMRVRHTISCMIAKGLGVLALPGPSRSPGWGLCLTLTVAGRTRQFARALAPRAGISACPRERQGLKSAGSAAGRTRNRRLA